MFGGNTPDDSGNDNLHFPPSYLPHTQARYALEEEPGSDTWSKGIKNSYQKHTRDPLGQCHRTNRAERLAREALAYPSWLNAFDLEKGVFFVQLRTQARGELGSRILVTTLLAMTLREDYNSLGEQIAKIVYKGFHHLPGLFRLPNPINPDDPVVHTSWSQDHEDLSPELGRLQELAKKRKGVSITAIVPNESIERFQKPTELAQKEEGK